MSPAIGCGLWAVLKSIDTVAAYGCPPACVSVVPDASATTWPSNASIPKPNGVSDTCVGSTVLAGSAPPPETSNELINVPLAELALTVRMRVTNPTPPLLARLGTAAIVEQSTDVAPATGELPSPAVHDVVPLIGSLRIASTAVILGSSVASASIWLPFMLVSPVLRICT